MVGNDVVDLIDAEIGARHPRFDERAFAPCERRRIEAAGVASPLRWVLWAAKESAFKVAKRCEPSTVFSPSRFVVELDEGLRGSVQNGGNTFPVRVTQNESCVHAVATRADGDPESVLAGVRRVAGDVAGDREATLPGDEARAFAVVEIARRLEASPDSLRIEKRGRIPHLFHCDGRDAADLSLSHHGRFVAYACVLPGTSAR